MRLTKYPEKSYLPHDQCVSWCALVCPLARRGARNNHKDAKQGTVAAVYDRGISGGHRPPLQFPALCLCFPPLYRSGIMSREKGEAQRGETAASCRGEEHEQR